ncbi:carboxy-terminal-processing protease [Geobacter sp. OR-1]|uniref:S41 family peptidase n=1 Tax=Geobacter sp. OR-1 TaxID=1266765 RepID=UPI00054388C3|nr:S41 family peptidase [Geobacter sp. OR-1]GAM09382.1 carboxy-terminal-processing protease [Geobacter sp. OR-1]
MKKNKLLLIIVAIVVIVIICSIFIGKYLLKESHRSTELENIKLFREVLSIVKKEYVEEVDSKKLLQSAINGMLSSLDPHSSYMPADSFKEMKVQMSGSFGGIGIEISMKDNKLTIIAPIEDTPGYRAGLKANDHIWKINDKFTKGMTINDAVGMMRGEKGTKVTLTIMREGNGGPMTFPIVRDIIQTKSLRSRTVDAGIGYIRIGHFQETTGAEFAKSLKTLKDQNNGAIKGLIIDLRNNPGGLLNQAVEVANNFIGEGFGNGLVVYTEGREPTAKMKLSTKIGDKEPHYPIIILVNGGSASASEILAGAMQDHKRAIILGTQTFGKGSVQSVLPLRDNAGLKLTTARYYTPNGRSIQAKGITPDIIVNRLLPQEPKKNQADQELKENDLEGRLKPVEKPGKPAAKPAPDKPVVTKIDEEVKNDHQLARAVELLKGLDIMSSRVPGAAK